MPRYFTHYWQMTDGKAGAVMDHTAGNDFKKRGVARNDYLYVVNVYQGRLLLVGRMQVGWIVDLKTARRMLDYEPWEASDHCIAIEGSASLVSWDRFVPDDMVTELRIIRADETVKPPVLKSDQPPRLDAQTLRGVRRLTPESAAMLDRLLDVKSDAMVLEPDPNEASSPAGCGAGFADAETNRKVEIAAVACVQSDFAERGWAVRSVEREYCGYDLICSKGNEELHVEVKGVAGNQPAFIITAAEVQRAKTDSRFTLCVVTNALTDAPTLRRWDGRAFIEQFRLDAIQFRACLDQRGTDRIPTKLRGAGSCR